MSSEKTVFEIDDLLSENYQDMMYYNIDMQIFTLGKSVIARKSYGVMFEWIRGKITAINTDGTYKIYFLDGEIQDAIIKENIRLFDTTKIYLPPNPDFSFITDRLTRIMIESGYNVVMISEGWKMIREFSGKSFMYSNNPKMIRLMDAVNDNYNDGHSGCSIGYTMRILERISHVGMSIFKKEWENKNKK